MNICLFGSARDTVPKVYITKTEDLGRAVARRGHGLIFGGGAAGMMGAAARGVHSLGGRIVSVAPDFFQKPGVLVDYDDELIVTSTMAQRKTAMVERADAFVVAPGGVGTLDEFFEAFTLKSLGLHQGPLALYNVAGFFDGLLDFLKKAEGEDFFLPGLLEMVGVFDDPEALLDYLESAVERSGDGGSSAL